MEDLTGRRFNRLVATIPLYLYRREWVWECKCDCGKMTKVRISKLKNGLTKSCGCFKNENLDHKEGKEARNWKGYKDISMSFYSRMRASADQRSIPFRVSPEYLWKLFKLQKEKCAYTGKILKMPINVRQLRGENNEDVASLDRKDSSMGYIPGNVQWVCKRVNYMKHTMNDKYFESWIKAIYEHRGLG